MRKIQCFLDFCKKPIFILILIVLSFFLREVFLAVLFPMLKGQDETMHYITVQFLAEPREKIWNANIEGETNLKDIRKLDSYNSSEELRETIRVAELNIAQSSVFSKLSFTDSYEGKNEGIINSRQWKKYIETYPPGIVGGGNFYHWLASLMEKLFGNQSILFRFFLVRIFSVFLGTVAVFLSYFLIKNVGFSEKNSLIMTAIVSLQPKFSVYTTNINYDSLVILIFTLFALGGVLFLKNGLDWKNGLILIGSFAAGLFTKGTGIVLAGPLIVLFLFYAYKRIKAGKISMRQIVFALSFFIIATVLFFTQYNISTIIPPSSNNLPLGKFLSKSIPKIFTVSKNYWGNLDWTRNDYSEDFIRIIWALEAVAVAGIFIFLALKKKPDFLPEKKYIIFLLIILLALQVGIQFNDWKITSTGQEAIYASPGRYFLPNLTAHIAVMFTGIGMVLQKQKYFDYALLFGLVLMFAFNFYMIFNIIIPRFYF